jgi:hypothetical protein
MLLRFFQLLDTLVCWFIFCWTWDAPVLSFILQLVIVGIWRVLWQGYWPMHSPTANRIAEDVFCCRILLSLQPFLERSEFLIYLQGALIVALLLRGIVSEAKERFSSVPRKTE